ncbi:MAG TPA: tRNA uridine-5-carboxymethylaminomethyl(34) synthesis GTPase MnmE [Candidatus Scybalomonas excrementigallinarum]|nr:tRNA uridine-5-carboxymethylaminomethyl(34) synthesis GTPase MnmE [Candidatus Scybalomonas excrementigallinarum]
MKTDTIAAIATAMTNSGIGIIRISGERAIPIIKEIFRPRNAKKDMEMVESYTAHYGFIEDQGEVIDECIVLVMRAPATYTKEDVVEIDSHGGVIVMRKILELVLRHGARPAEPGEFTKRAFLNGRIDLSQAEAVMDLISAKNEFAMESSLKQLRGSVKKKIEKLRKDIIHQVAFIESALDDPEHYSVDGYGEELLKVLRPVEKEVSRLIESSSDGKILKEGIKTAIVGKPNAGKSSLLNVMVGEERAIVTEIAGTTRDTLEESIYIHGIPLQIIDTAGIRDTEDIVEKIGVNKAKDAVDEADLVLYVIDGSKELDENDREIMELVQGKKVITLLNKSDLEKQILTSEIEQKLNGPVISISAKEETGIDEFYDALKEMFFEGQLEFNDEIYITNMRHKTALMNAKESLEQVVISIENQMPEDFYSIDLMNAYEELGFIIGESLEEDLVNEIFREFCMGK